MTQRNIFAGPDPFTITQRWLDEATKTELNDPNAIALATVDAQGLPNVRIVLLKEIEHLGEQNGAFLFYTNYTSPKSREIDLSGKAAFVMHWKSLGRQIRVRGEVTREEGLQADAYFATRSVTSRLGAWASRQSQPLESREALMDRLEEIKTEQGENPARPPFWGGFRINPVEVEFWADGPFRLHDRFRWTRNGDTKTWLVERINP